MSEFPATDWTRYDVPAIASMLLDDDFADAWSQVHAWLAAYETISVHQSQLAKAQSELAEAWPPEKSPASAAYLENVADLHASMAETAEIAFNNSRALSNSLDALSAAQITIRQLHEQWQANAAATSGDATHAAWAKSLNAQVQQVMHTTDQIIFQNTQRFVAPTVMPVITAAFDPLSPLQPSTGRAVGKSRDSARNSKLIDGSGRRQSSAVSTPPPGENTSRRVIPTIMPTSVEGQGGSTLSRMVGTTAGLASATSVLAGGQSSATRSDDASSTASLLGNDETSPDGRGSHTDASTTTGRTPQAHGQSSAPSERDEMLSPGLGVPPNSSSSRRGMKRRRTRVTFESDQQRTVPSIIVPRKVEPVVHDPGPGVIGIDR
jgi:hypothetical protein